MGGLENALANLVTHTTGSRLQHVIICLKGYTDFSRRIAPAEIKLFSLDKQPGKDPGVYLRLWKLLRELKPSVVHTRNVGTLFCIPIARVAGVANVVHSVHGFELPDIQQKDGRLAVAYRLLRPLIRRHVAVSADLAKWMAETLRMPKTNIVQIDNGVDCTRFSTEAEGRIGFPFAEASGKDKPFVIGFVGRLEPIKDLTTLLDACSRLVKSNAAARERLRLCFVGDGSLRPHLEHVVASTGLAAQVWFAGYRDDIADFLRSIDLFVLPSLLEGSSNTLLEAMASGLPAVATRVGGNVDIVHENQTGTLVPVRDPVALAQAIEKYMHDPLLVKRHGAAARQRAVDHFSLEKMVRRYEGVYRSLLPVPNSEIVRL